MPKIYEYLGLIILFHSNEHEPIHVHGKCQGRENKAELITRASLPTTILPTAANDPQAVKARREVVARAMSSVSQTRVWNVLIDVVAQSGHFKPNASNLQNDFIVEGEQHYWVHVAIDRFTGQVIDKQIEVVNE